MKIIGTLLRVINEFWGCVDFLICRSMPFIVGGAATIVLTIVTATANPVVGEPSSQIQLPRPPQGKNSPEPTKELGAKVFAQRCVLCHGAQGMGEGILPLKFKGYPDTNLMTGIKAKGREQIFKAVAYGGMLAEYTENMPPYGAALSWTELESVTRFVEFLRTDPNAARELVRKDLKRPIPTVQVGREVFSTRCVLCHGPYGEGDGRMRKVIKNPPPFDLTASRLPDVYLKDIIMKGGAAMGRSKHMPPWGDQLNDFEIAALINYLKTIRD